MLTYVYYERSYQYNTDQTVPRSVGNQCWKSVSTQMIHVTDFGVSQASPVRVQSGRCHAEKFSQRSSWRKGPTEKLILGRQPVNFYTVLVQTHNGAQDVVPSFFHHYGFFVLPVVPYQVCLGSQRTYQRYPGLSMRSLGISGTPAEFTRVLSSSGRPQGGVGGPQLSRYHLCQQVYLVTFMAAHISCFLQHPVSPLLKAPAICFTVNYARVIDTTTQNNCLLPLSFKKIFYCRKIRKSKTNQLQPLGHQKNC